MIRGIGLALAGATLGAVVLTSAADARGASTSRSCLTSPARALLKRIEARFGHVTIVSTCRPGARIAGTGRISRHASGNAVDFLTPSGKKRAVVRWLIANHRSGGVMTYRGMNHIHVDIGPRFVSLGARG
ncbi:MAG: D-Ala-D-Ala carboxypeptidase family metallohydrolase [Hyphomicrobiaceae bacterium]